jgi:hypothetical protein
MVIGAMPARQRLYQVSRYTCLQIMPDAFDCCGDNLYACRDDCGRLALHWSAELGLAEVCQLLLQATTEAAAALTARVAAASADAEAGEEPLQLELPNLLEMQVGCTFVGVQALACSCIVKGSRPGFLGSGRFVCCISKPGPAVEQEEAYWCFLAAVRGPAALPVRYGAASTVR